MAKYTSLASLLGDGLVSLGNGIKNTGEFIVGEVPGQIVEDAADKVVDLFSSKEEPQAPVKEKKQSNTAKKSTKEPIRKKRTYKKRTTVKD